MQAQPLYSQPVGLSRGLGFLSILAMMCIFSGLFVLWSFSCLGGGMVTMMSLV
jgi:hypothetical protein